MWGESVVCKKFYSYYVGCVLQFFILVINYVRFWMVLFCLVLEWFFLCVLILVFTFFVGEAGRPSLFKLVSLDYLLSVWLSSYV